MKFLKKIINKYRAYIRRRISRMYFERKKSKLEKLKSKFNNDRCFIIGNGPSLTIDDLNKLTNEYCFGSNRIYKSFVKTRWRPTFYVLVDKVLFKNIKKNLSSIIECCDYTFMNSDLYNIKYYKSDLNLLYVNDDRFDIPEFPKFSEDITNGVYEGYTVTYTCIQMAVYLGFKEIYMLGVDHSYSRTLAKDGKIKKENTNNYSKILDVDENIIKHENIPRLDWTTNAYIKAKEVCESKNIVIKNATRGGKLEVFERINFDELMR